jgi:outer membrane biosynthesis protein TonB
MKYSSKGLIGTILFHLFIMLVLIFFGFSYPFPPPPEQAVLINFGLESEGSGQLESGSAKAPEGTEAISEAAPPESLKDEIEESMLVTQSVKSTPVQEVEETRVKASKPTEAELKQIELQKIRLEEEKKKKAEEERQKQIAEQWNAKGKNAFGNKNSGKDQGTQGVNDGEGSQGKSDGNNNSAGNTGLEGGNGFGLGNRGLRGDLPKPMVEGCTVTSRIIIKVQINVDRDGNVAGDPKITDSNFQDQCIYQAVIKAARDAKFTKDTQAPYLQQGWIRYTIEP